MIRFHLMNEIHCVFEWDIFNWQYKANDSPITRMALIGDFLHNSKKAVNESIILLKQKR